MSPWLAGGRAVVELRYALCALSALWAWAALRQNRLAGVAAGVAFVTLGLAFWGAALARPYGLLVDADHTRSLSALAVSRVSGRSDVGVLSGTTEGSRIGALAGSAGLPLGLVLLLPTYVPLLVPVAIGLAVHVLYRPDRPSPVPFILWMACSTGDLDALDGVGLVPGLWPHAGSSLLVGLLAILALAAGRLVRRRGWAAAAIAAATLAGSLLAPGGPRLDPAATLRVLLVDPAPWIVLALHALVLDREPVSVGLLAGGAAGLLAASLQLGNAWSAHALYRLGALLAASGPAERLAIALGEEVRRRVRPLAGPVRREGLGAALLVLLTAPGSFLAWWQPFRMDAVAAASAAPLSSRLVRAAGFVRDATPKDAVFVASPEYASALAALAGRRVLRAPGLLQPPDEGLRELIEARLLKGKTRPPTRFDVTHLFVGPGDGDWVGDLPVSERGRLVYRDEKAFAVYEWGPSP